MARSLNSFTLNKTRVIKSESDFPAINGSGQHPLEAGIHYWIDGLVSIANNLLLPTTGTCTIGSLSTASVLTYTGGGTMFINTNLGASAFSLWDCSFGGNGTAKLFDVADGGSGSEIFYVNVNFIDFSDLGDINIASFSGTFASIIGYQTGFDFTIASDFFIDATIFFPDTPGSTNSITLNMGANTIAQIVNDTPFVGAGENFLNIPSTANDFRMTVSGNLIPPGGGELFNSSGLNHSDKRITSSENPGFANSSSFGSMFLGVSNINATATAIATIGVPVATNGTFNSDGLERFSFSSSGTLTYTGLEDKRLPIKINFRGANVTGNNKDFSFYLSQGNDTENTISLFGDSVADPGVDTTVTSTAHGLSAGDRVPITNTTDYDLVHTITRIVDTDNFDIDFVFQTAETSGNWEIILEDTLSSNNYSANDAKNVSQPASLIFSTNDFIKQYIQNDTDTTNFIQTELKVLIN